MKTIAVYHNKGGVGKTTLTINLAASFSRKGHRVLLIDLDSQANSTYAAGLVKFQDELQDDIKDNYVYHVIRERNAYFIPDVARASKFTTHSFSVVPSHIDLMQHEKELIEIAPSRTRLFSKLQKVNDDYDIVIIDTPPSLNIYAQIALIAADYLLIPSDLKPFANEGLRNVQQFILETNEFREQVGREALNVLGIVPSKIATSYKFLENILPRMEQTVKERYGFPVLKSRILDRRDVSAAIERSIEVGDLEIPDPISIFDYKPGSQAADEFESLSHEVMQLIGA
ncbi:MAG: ParA family protein (plasmid) [Leptolyngbya sp. BL-A-14]